MTLTRSQAFARALVAPAFGLTLGLGLIIAACTLTPAQAALVETVDVTACSALTAALAPIPIAGEVAALACPLEEAGLKAKLDADIAAHPPASTLPPPADSPATKRALVTRPGATPTAPRVLVGLAPAHRAARLCAAYDAAARADAGVALLAPLPDAGTWHTEVAAVAAVAPLDAGADGQTLAELQAVLAAQGAELQRLGVIVEAHAGARATRARDAGAEGGR